MEWWRSPSQGLRPDFRRTIAGRTAGHRAIDLARGALVALLLAGTCGSALALDLGPIGSAPVFEGTLTMRHPLFKDEIINAWIALDPPSLAKMLEGTTGNMHEVSSAGSVPAGDVAARFDFKTGGGAAALVVRLPGGSGHSATVEEDPGTPGGLEISVDRLGRLDSSVEFHAYRIFRVPAHVAPVPLRIILVQAGNKPPIVRRLIVDPQAQKSSDPASKGSAGFRAVASGTFCAVYKAGEELIASQEALDALWKKIHADMTPVPPVPAVDFAKEQVVAVFAGQKSSGGHSIAVEAVAVDGDTARVTVRLAAPRKGGIVTMALTAPYVLIAIARGPHTLSVTRLGP